MALEYIFILSCLLFPLCEGSFYSLRADDATGSGHVSLDQYQGMVGSNNVLVVECCILKVLYNCVLGAR
jgi:hypothetical protein